MKRVVLGILILVIIAGGWYFLNNESGVTGSSGDGAGVLELISENDFDFGEILMTGGDVKYNYTLKNTGKKPVRITSAKTSCLCTTANIFDTDGKSAGEFGMGGGHGANPEIDMEILPGEEITVEATYDPLAHGPDATGTLIREIFITTDSAKEIKLKFRGKGVKEFSKAEGPSLAFNNREYDFGITDQSGGIFETKFEVVNNGSETVAVDSLPTSCQCVSASIDKKEIAVGEKAVITVTFDANLHAEPEGRFFKTIEIVSNVKPSPELKIFANMNYDLGAEKLKLGKNDDDSGHDNSDENNEISFKSISSDELSTMLENKDFTLIDVHIPEQEHIPGTDYMIAYNDVDKIISEISSKDAKVVLYCKSGNMSKKTSKALAEKGYTNIFELDKGLNEWKATGKEVLPKGSVESL